MECAGSDGKISETTVTDPDGSVRRVRFHASGWPSEETEAFGTALERTTYFERNALGFKQAVVDPLGRRTELGYDSLQRLISTTVLAGTAQALTTSVAYNASHDPISSTDPEGRVTTYIWDARRRLQKVIDDRQRAVTYAYDSQDRVTSVTDPEQHMTTFSYQLHDLVKVTDTEGRTVKRYVDALGRTQSISDAQGRTAKLEYDALDRVIKQIAPDGSNTSFTYDPMGNLKSLTDANLSITRWDYDSRQRPIKRTDALNQFETWSYNEAARIVTHTDRRLRSTTQSYDLHGRLTSVDYGSGETIALTHDIGDRLQSITDAAGTISYQYDLLDSITRETTPAGYIDYTYDAFGRPTAMMPNGHPATNYAYDTHARLASIARANEAVVFAYDAQDRLIGIMLPNGTQRNHSFDPNDRLSHIEYRRGATLIGDLDYSFDEAGQLIERSGSLADDLLPVAVTANASTDANHRVTAFNAQTLSYDANGNLIDDGQRQYRYDRRDRLIGIDQGSVEVESFQYDVFGRRIARTKGGITTTYRYDGGNVVEDTTSGIVTATLNGFGLDERYSRVGPNGTSTYLTDALGSTLGLQGSSGQWQARYRYTPYGETQAEAFDANGTAMPPGAAADTALAELNNPYQYTGRENDGDGLYYYRARYYSPQMGRFTQEDPLGLGDGPNQYAYVKADPVNSKDPTGRNSVVMACMQMPELCAELFGTIAESQAAIQAKLGNTCESEYYRAVGGLMEASTPFVVAAQVLVVMMPSGVASAAAKPTQALYHGTDIASARRLLGGAPLDAGIAAGAKIDGAAGFFLATHADDAAYFAARRGDGGILEYRFTDEAVRALGGLPISPLGALGRFGRFLGGETRIEPSAFGDFNRLLEAGEIVIYPH